MESLVAVVETANCQKLRNHLESLHLYNKKYKCVQLNEHEIAIPLTDDSEEHPEFKNIDSATFMLNEVLFYIRRRVYKPSELVNTSPCKKLQNMVKDMMIAKDLWQNSFIDEIPKSWEKFGDMVLFDSRKHFKHSNWNLAGNELWLCICSVLKVKRIALKHHIKNDDYRSPSAKLVWGDSSWASFSDNGIRYNWNIEKNMFSVGNAPERQRVATFDCTGEVIVDMFAGIGYFTLPYLVHAKAKLVYACEWNPDAVEALRKNLTTNNVLEKCIIKEGDNRKICPTNVADRINLGLLPSSEDSWRAACLALKSTGGILHIHGNVSKLLPTSNNSSNHKLSKMCRSRFDAVSSLDNVCKICEKVISELPDSCLTVVSKDFFISSVSDIKNSFFISTNNFIPHNENKTLIQWKKKTEWKIWALHVCHCIASLLHDIHGEETVWKVTVIHLHNVKSYGPHIHHLVLDLKCEQFHVNQNSCK